MCVNLCIVLYFCVIIYIMFTFDSELKLILTLLCKNPTMIGLINMKKHSFLKYDIIMSQQRSYPSL